MPKVSVFVSVALVIAQVSWSVGQQFITPEQAMEAVRAFEGKPDLEFSTVDLQHDTSGPSWSHRSWYSLLHRDYPEVPHDWMVDARTGEVISAYYGDAVPSVPVSKPFGPLTKEQCYQIAENFARTKYQGFDQMNLQLVEEEWTGKGWRFEWRQKLAFGALGINGVEVEVNPADGRIQNYSADRISALPPKEPKLTREEAIEKAKEAAGISEVDWIEGPELLADPIGNVYWGLALGGIDADGNYRGYAITLNAETGEVISKAPQRIVAEPLILSHFRVIEQRKGKWLIVAIGFLILMAGITFIFRKYKRWRAAAL